MLLVHFLCVEAKNNNDVANQSEYIKNIYNKLCAHGLISGLVVTWPINGHIDQDAINEVEDGIFVLRYEYKELQANAANIDEKCSYVFQIQFTFGTFNSGLQLSIYISSDSYIPTVDNVYLERLKFAIKDQVKRDWQKIEWLVDKDSECLAVNLYPVIFRTENLARQMISETMVKLYGSSWWDKFVTEDIVKKHKARNAGYKTTAPGFANIDDRLLSIDIGDLLKILTRKILKWNPSYDEAIGHMVNDKAEWNCDKVKEILKSQTVVEIDLWESVFKTFLPVDFPAKVEEFDNNRNHVAHNKLLDRQAYASIKQNVVAVKSVLEEGINSVLEHVVSVEERARIEEELAEQEEEERAALEEIMESEAGVEIRHVNEIEEILEEAVDQVYLNVSEALRFRQDIEIEQCVESINVRYKITDEEIVIHCETTVDDSEGASSTVVLSVDDGTYRDELTYIDGGIEYNFDQANYYPTVENEEPDIESVSDRLVEYINETCPNLRQQADADAYKLIKDGDGSPVCGDIACDECGEFYIAVTDDYAPKGTCLNCGAKHELNECIRCGCYFVGIVREDDAPLCDNCKEYIERQ